ncbi:MAG: glycerophosphodiester phosphodiesterase [Gemmatimonadetes bacterium]|jgi:glycerophosphoryl diester phosphodiesterase|nr:glycerophosphodiester phosphodiesterase [Gemmatimonadota bacterium]MBT6148797.1 glycerophosphodiester phosphodiesterase [Gemmatimonadota bacterium]MBT7860723.1 glycerophosphodiester phosphodiesterase [Gemmatimonadota bacterium]
MIHPLRIAHRGASAQAPENTLAAFEQAIRLGVDMLEIDVRASCDGEVVVIHDAAIDRTTNRVGQVAELSFEQLRQADAGSWFDAQFKGEQIPTLSEVLDLARHRAIVLIEIKADHLAERVLQQISAAGAQDAVVVQSFDPETVRRIKSIEPMMPTSLLMGDLPKSPSRLRARRMVREVLAVGANALSIWHAALTPAFHEEMRMRGISVWVWTVDEEVVLRDVTQLGVQGIITNHPDRLNDVLLDLERDGAIISPPGRRQRIKPSRWGRRRRIRRAGDPRRSQ